ncbi:MAG TPA: trypsin-like peptidase domain-containing protein, partial [Sedimentisphaerales bacterium]|nr:trypsin-like peptidase domain-containing protein [Sedimentisphaerales bacterium]
MRHLKNIVVLFLALNPVGVVYAAAASNGAREVTLSFREAVRRAKPAVVYIEARTRARRGFRMGYEQASGSGVIIDAAKGYVVTAAHVIEDATEVVVRLEDGRQFIAKNIWGDRESDVGVVQIEADNLPQAAFGNSDALEVGDWVLAIGSPFGRALENSVSVGIVSAKGRRTGILGAMGIEDFIQTDAVINRGNSGGPLVNIDGEVIGINSNIISSTGMNAGLGFAVPSKLAQATVEQLTTTGRVARGYMGVSLASLTDLESSVAENIP